LDGRGLEEGTLLWVGVDIGGTFTDIVVYDEVTRQICTVKTPSLHENLTRGILTGLQKADTPLPSVSRLVHGTTIATNTVLEGKGARTAVVTTKGFRDVLELGYGNRVVLYTGISHIKSGQACTDHSLLFNSIRPLSTGPVNSISGA
ncbi:MAG: hydantoinase/oxoprolinase N-terminal domain-containing protein, partial [Nitrospinota bacterium]|nr:hydantoinase/oxoprolinase N-terminal domain-containing protein [Nitrospinota bacterium]